MPSSRVLLVPVIGTVAVVAVLVALALWLLMPAIRYQRAKARQATQGYSALVACVRSADAAICGVISTWEQYPGSQDYLPEEVRDGVYRAHSAFQELERKGIQ